MIPPIARRASWRRLAPASVVAAGLWCCAAPLCAQTTDAPPAPKAAEGRAAAQRARVLSDRWYNVEMMGAKAGSMHVRVEEVNATITTTSRIDLSIGRGDARVKISMASTFVETSDGKPISMRSRSKTGQMETVQEYTFGATSISVKSTQAGRTTTQELTLPEEPWMTPAAAERYALAEYKAGSRVIEVRTMDALMGATPVSAKREGFTPATITLDGKNVEALKTTVTSSAAPGLTSVEYLDDKLDMLQTTTQVGGIEMVMRRTTRSDAKSSPAGNISPELMLSTFVKPDVAIERPRMVTRGTYVLSTPGAAMPDLPTTGTQSAERVNDATVRIVVTREAASRDVPEETAPYLASSLLADTSDEKIVSLVKATLEKEPGASKARKAELLRRAVHAYISEKSLGVGFATASEVVRTREGDCSEHGVLLAALLRVAGIPSRGVTGLIYADTFAGQSRIFGYHMWAQALLEGDDGTMRWVDLDATLPDEHPYDATHITLATSDLSDGDPGQGFISLAQVIGTLQIKVVDVEHAAP